MGARTSLVFDEQNQMKDELARRLRAPWIAFKPLKEATNHLTDIDLQANLFKPAVLLARGGNVDRSCYYVKDAKDQG